MMTLKELAGGAFNFNDVKESAQRTKGPKERPKEKVELLSLAKTSTVHAKVKKDPTDDLIELQAGDDAVPNAIEVNGTAFCIWCNDTKQMWFAHNQLCLDANFIFRDDLIIKQVSSTDEVVYLYKKWLGEYTAPFVLRQTCYLLDLPANETYEVYYASNYPTLAYGFSTPQGGRVIKYKNRFHRDMAILELDEVYSNSSNKTAGKLTARDFASNEAIVVSDGAWQKNNCASSVYYLDAENVMQITQGRFPTEPEQAVLIAEVRAAYLALSTCYMYKKKRITYYYDNTSIINIFKNRKTEYISEIKEYKELCDKLLSEGYNVKFIEIHPKTGEDRDEYNKALMFFHNRCDDACTHMCDIIQKDYKSFTTSGNGNGDNGKTYKQVKEEFKPKGRPKQVGNRNQVNNRHGSYNRG